MVNKKTLDRILKATVVGAISLSLSGCDSRWTESAESAGQEKRYSVSCTDSYCKICFSDADCLEPKPVCYRHRCVQSEEEI